MKKIVVCGVGVMGGGIAQVSAKAGYEVWMYDLTDELAQRGKNNIAAGLEKQAEKSGKKPLMTTFSVYNLARNNVFDYSKAQRELGYTTRPYQETIYDEVQWLIEEGLIEA